MNSQAEELRLFEAFKHAQVRVSVICFTKMVLGRLNPHALALADIAG